MVAFLAGTERSEGKWDERKIEGNNKAKESILSCCVKLGVTMNEALKQNEKIHPRTSAQTHKHIRPHTTETNYHLKRFDSFQLFTSNRHQASNGAQVQSCTRLPLLCWDRGTTLSSPSPSLCLFIICFALFQHFPLPVSVSFLLFPCFSPWLFIPLSVSKPLLFISCSVCSLHILLQYWI